MWEFIARNNIVGGHLGKQKHCQLGGGANWVVAPIGVKWWRQLVLSGGANRARYNRRRNELEKKNGGQMAE